MVLTRRTVVANDGVRFIVVCVSSGPSVVDDVVRCVLVVEMLLIVSTVPGVARLLVSVATVELSRPLFLLRMVAAV